MTDTLAIEPISSFRTTLRPPGSKSLTNRALLLAALANGESCLTGVLFSDDTRVMIAALQTLGFELKVSEEDCTVRIIGLGGRFPQAPVAPRTLHLGNAGTAMRFLTAACCLSESAITLDGIPRMRERPIGQLVDALQAIGASVSYTGNDGFPPLTLGGGGGGLLGGDLAMPPTLSSQFISAMLQVGPYCKNSLTLSFNGPVISRPYVEMTMTMMAKFGVACEVNPTFTEITIPTGCYQATDYDVEPDASNASYFLAAAAVVPGSKCTVEGLGFKSLQGDVWFAELLQQMGASVIYERDAVTVMAPPTDEKLQAIDIDLNAMPDMAQTLAVVALFAEGTTVMRNIASLRVKETDRMEALRIELTKLGATIEIDGDDLFVEPPQGGIMPAAIDTYDDHRMAMSFAIAGLAAPGIVINDPRCVEKTFPDYFEYLAALSDGNA